MLPANNYRQEFDRNCSSGIANFAGPITVSAFAGSLPRQRSVNRWDGGHKIERKESNRVHIDNIDPIHAVVKTVSNATALPISRNIHLSNRYWLWSMGRGAGVDYRSHAIVDDHDGNSRVADLGLGTVE